MDQLLGQQYPPRLGDRDRRRPDMLAEQPPQLAAADAEPVCQAFDIIAIETACFDQAERARYRVGSAAPERQLGRDFRPAAQAWAKAGLLGRGGGSIERHVLEFRRPRRADRPAVDAGGLDADEQPAVEAGVPSRDRAVTGNAVHIHQEIMTLRSGFVWRFSDIINSPTISLRHRASHGERASVHPNSDLSALGGAQ